MIPYEWFNNIDKIIYERSIPRVVFYSKLKQKEITYEEYNKALICWNESGSETIGVIYQLILKQM